MAFDNDYEDTDLGNNAQVVIGLFQNSSDAQQAIGDLREEGFRPTQIGAAFRETLASSQASPDVGMDTGRHLTENSYDGVDSSDTGSLGGPSSGSNAVTPAGLSTGSGMSMSGAGQPGPIPGSDIPHRRARSTEGEEPGLKQMASGTNAYPQQPSYITQRPSSINYPDANQEAQHGGWWEKLKHFFTDDEASEDSATQPGEGVREAADTFGTGKGALNLSDSHISSRASGNVSEPYDYAYSPNEFEASLSALGLEQREAKAFARQLGARGAIVTVAAGSKLRQAEKILERNNGRVRYEEDASYGNRTLDEPLTSSSSLSQVQGGGPDGQSRDRIQVFGEVRRAYEKSTRKGERDNDFNEDVERRA